MSTNRPSQRARSFETVISAALTNRWPQSPAPPYWNQETSEAQARAEARTIVGAITRRIAQIRPAFRMRTKGAAGGDGDPNGVPLGFGVRVTGDEQ